MSSMSASLDPSEEARLLANSQEHNNILSSAEDSDHGSQGEEEESDADGFVRSNQRVFFLLLDALFALVVRLWLATVSVSVVMFILRHMSMNSLLHQSGALMSNSEVDIYIMPKTHFHSATPALFGQIISEKIIAPIRVVNHKACSEFTQDFPKLVYDDIKHLSQEDQRLLIRKNETDDLGWIGLVERGGCPFDQKVFCMQQAGFKSVLIYNQINEPKDATVRMSAHSMGNQVTIFAAFMSRSAGRILKYYVTHQSSATAILKIEVKPTLWVSKKLVINALFDMAVLFVLVVVTGTGFLIFGITLNLIHNLFVHGRFHAIETIHEASLIILAVSNQSPNQPKLKTVEFPRRSLDESSLVNDWRSGGILGQESCPICIEDFQIGDQVRELPCQHIFHDTCVDPWLIKHNRLCPVCKRDVLKKKAKKLQKESSSTSAANQVPSSSSHQQIDTN